MAGGSSTSNPRTRKRVDADTNMNSIKRAKDGSAFARCEECKKDVPVVLIDMHSCSLDSKIKMRLEAHVVETVSEVKKPAERKKPAPSKSKNSSSKGKKVTTNADMPKRPKTAFFLFMDDFRKTFKEENPDNKLAKTVAKEGAAKWNSMTDEEKKEYNDKAEELKQEYKQTVEKLNNASEDEKEEEEGSSEKEQEEEGGSSEKEVAVEEDEE